VGFWRVLYPRWKCTTPWAEELLARASRRDRARLAAQKGKWAAVPADAAHPAQSKGISPAAPGHSYEAKKKWDITRHGVGGQSWLPSSKGSRREHSVPAGRRYRNKSGTNGLLFLKAYICQPTMRRFLVIDIWIPMGLCCHPMEQNN